MFKKMFLSALLCASAITNAAQLNLDLEFIITVNDAERTINSSVVVEENTPTAVMINGLDALAINFIAATDGENAIVQAQFFQVISTEEVVPTTEPLAVKVALGQPGTITVNDDLGSLVLVVTPTLVE